MKARVPAFATFVTFITFITSRGAMHSWLIPTTEPVRVEKKRAERASLPLPYGYPSHESFATNE